MFKRALIVIALFSAVLISGLAGAKASPPLQSGQQIAYGDTLSGTIDESNACQYYWFQGTIGDPIQIDMTRTSGGLDGVLWLYQQNSSDPLTSNDDRPQGGLDPLLTATLPATDWYTIAACRLDNPSMRVTTGTFMLTLTGPEAAPAAAEGDSADTSASSGGGANPGGANSTTLTEGVFGSAGHTIAPSPTPGSGGGLTEGLFGEPSPTPAPETTGGDVLADGSVVTGQLEPGAAEAIWQITANPGDLVSITWMRLSGDLPPQISALDAEGNLLAQASTMDDAALLQLVFRAQGPASLHVGRYEESAMQTSGEFQIGVTVSAASSTGVLPQPTVMATQAFVMPTVPTSTPAFVAPTPPQPRQVSVIWRTRASRARMP